MNKPMFFSGLALIAVQIFGGLLYLALTTLSLTLDTFKILIGLGFFLLLNAVALILIIVGLKDD